MQFAPGSVSILSRVRIIEQTLLIFCCCFATVNGGITVPSRSVWTYCFEIKKLYFCGVSWKFKKRGQVSPLFVLAHFRMEIREEIRKIAENKLTDPGHFVVDVAVSLRGKQKVLVFVDGDNGITIDDCANLSRAMSEELDRLPGLNERYVLEVSTPGVDHPLKFNRQYAKHIGRTLKVTLRDQSIDGKLVSVSNDAITLEQTLGTGKKKEVIIVEIKFSDIEKSFVLVSFK